MSKIITGDCLNVLNDIPSGYISATITSPPYNIGKVYEKAISLDEYIDWMREVIKECVRVTKCGGSIFWQTGNHISGGIVTPLDVIMYPIFIEYGMVLRNRIIWTFGHGLHCNKRFSGRHETMMWFTWPSEYEFNLDAVRVPQKYPNKRHYKGERKGQLSGNPLGKNPGDVWDITNVKHNHPEKTIHPCQFPEELVRRAMLCSTSPSDIVLDPFMGSGTVTTVAYKNNRQFIGIDINDEYTKIARNRLSACSEGKG